MTTDRFLRELAHIVGIGGAERRFVRTLGRTLGFRIAAPSLGTKPNSNPQPAATAEPKAEPKAERNNAAFASGVAHGRAGGFGKAFRGDLERWAVAAGDRFKGREVAADLFLKPTEYANADAERVFGDQTQYTIIP